MDKYHLICCVCRNYFESNYDLILCENCEQVVCPVCYNLNSGIPKKCQACKKDFKISEVNNSQGIVTSIRSKPCKCPDCGKMLQFLF